MDTEIKKAIGWLESRNIITYKCPYCGYLSSAFFSNLDEIIDNEEWILVECENENCLCESKIYDIVASEEEMLRLSKLTNTVKSPRITVNNILAYWEYICSNFDKEIVVSGLQNVHEFDISQIERSYLEKLSDIGLLVFYGNLVYMITDVALHGDCELQRDILLHSLEEEPEIVNYLLDF